MSLLIESIRIENKQLQNIELHNNRFNNAVKHLYSQDANFMLESIIQIPQNIGNERYKCRILFDGNTFTQDIQLYEQRKIATLKLINVDNIDYAYKTTDREKITAAFGQRGESDDIIIVKNGFLTDSSIANIILFDGDKWVTPTIPLLKGTQRQFLLNNAKIVEKKIHFNDLKNYTKIKLINAMVDFDCAIEINVNNIK